VTRLVKIRHFLNLIARGDRVKKRLSLSMTRQLKSLPRHPNPAPLHPPIRQFALWLCSGARYGLPPGNQRGNHSTLQTAALSNEGLPENLRRLGLRLLRSFREPRESWGRISTRRAFRNTPEHSTEILGSSSSTERLRGR
jgi:hypothetical protein